MICWQRGFHLPIICSLSMILIFLLIHTGSIYSQVPYASSKKLSFRSSQLDTSRLLSDRPLKSPWGAVLRSAILPGWGQIYTGHYLKAPVAFALNSFMVYQIYHYEQEWRREKNEGFRNKRNLYTWYFALTYVLTMADAYVDAWLYKFDTAMRISQMMNITEDGKWYAGLQFSYSF